MVVDTPLYKLTATQARERFDSGSLTVEEYAKALLDRIQEREPIVKAWAYLSPELVLKNARELDKVPRHQRGPLFGVAVGVKDMIYTKDMPTQHNSPIYKGDFPQLDAGPIISIRSQGALIVGKTTTTEFASTTEGTKTSNPHDPRRTPGGSSSGSAAAVADYHIPLSLGTQTGGSTIRPGSYNGIFAMKPTWGSISREGLKIYSITCDTLGIFSRCPEDLDLLTSSLGIKDDDDDDDEFENISIGVCRTPMWDAKAGPGTIKAMDDAILRCRRFGFNVEEVKLPEKFNEIPKWHKIILAGEGRAAFHGDYCKSKDLLHDFLQGHVENRGNYSRKELLESYDEIANLRPVIDGIAGKYSCLLAPSVPDVAPIGLESTGDASFNGMWTALHVPVLNIPAFKGEEDMPVGLSIIKPRYQDQSLIKLSKILSVIFSS